MAISARGRPGVAATGLLASLLLLGGCAAGDDGADRDADAGGELADVIAVDVTGEAGSYTFAVTVRSPDTGCEQYADFWEVVTPEGELVHRRVLAHSHVDEQPFTRSGGPVAADPGDRLVVRAHMSPGGYGGAVATGTPAEGFVTAGAEPGFAPDLGTVPPTVGGCAF